MSVLWGYDNDGTSLLFAFDIVVNPRFIDGISSARLVLYGPVNNSNRIRSIYA